MSKNWKWFLPGYVMLLPHTLVGFLFFALIYWPRDWKWHGGYWTCIVRNGLIGGPWVGAQTHGNIVFCRDEKMRQRTRLRVHECVHIVQEMLLGPLYMLIYGLHFAWKFVTKKKGENWIEAYYDICFEVQAYRIEKEYAKGKRPDAWGTEN